MRFFLFSLLILGLFTNTIFAYDASYVIGQSDFTSSGSTRTQSGLNTPGGISFDSDTGYLYVSDVANRRVMVFDLSNITNGESAISVLGQDNFTDLVTASDQDNFFARDVAVDSVNQRLFVASDNENRVLVFDISSISNGEDAVNVLGQEDFITTTDVLDQDGTSNVKGLGYDSVNDLLYSVDSAQHRIVIYDTASISNGEDAVNVLGQEDFTSNVTATDQDGFTSPYNVEISADGNTAFVADGVNSRVLVFDVSTITDGENAVNVLLAPDFVTADFGTTSSRVTGTWDLAYDDNNERLFVLDLSFPRILVFDLTTITDDKPAASIIGQNAFDAMNTGTTAATFGGAPAGIEYDDENNRLIVSDDENNRILIYEFIEITTSSVPNGSVNVAYDANISTQKEQGTVEYSVVSGDLPPGVTTDSTGISGIPTNAGTYNFTIRATDVVVEDVQEFWDEQSFTLEIAEAGVEPSSGPTITSTGTIGPTVLINHNAPITFNNGVFANLRTAVSHTHYALSRDENPGPITPLAGPYMDVLWDLCDDSFECESGYYSVYADFYANGNYIRRDSDDIYYKKCPQFTKYARRGRLNNRREVVRIQEFLNEYESENLSVSGTFDKETEDAVRRFQLKYAKEILEPWNISGPSGWWYKTTSSWANYIYGCPTENLYLERVDKVFKHPNPYQERLNSPGLF